ncbi:MAG TPA: iron-containing alcohol dehydrogenase [Tepidisphaeraceae bacterium]|jgi:alcohol dehydrogenase class IV|nr:iron-containing alcohol dehydrogenase [Tepidisphaeraceae bacterium]
MQPFEFFGTARIIFGRGISARAGELAAGLGKSPLIIHNSDHLIDRLVQLLSATGTPAPIRRQRGEPTVADIDASVELARRHNCDSVVALGGGSAIDAAKATAGLLTNDGSAIDYMEIIGKGRKITRPALPWMAIPITAGTGAEATRNAVIGLPEKKFKASIRSELLLPQIALVDPELGIGVPPPITASSGMDALCQSIESYTSTGASPLTDVLALRGVHLAARYLPRAFHDGNDLEAREGMSLAALLSGMTLTNAGLGAVHGFASPLGANFPIPHGTICAALLPHVIAANVRTLREQPQAAGMQGLTRYAQIGRQLPDFETAADNDAIDACVHFTANLLRELHIPPLNQFGLRLADIPEMVALARKASSMRFNPVVMSDESLSAVLMAAIDGKIPS